MTKEERVLRWRFPERETFTREELLEARRVVSRDEMKDDSAGRLPTKFIRIGGMVSIFGKIYRCVEADRDLQTDPCRGCDIRNLNCSSRVPQCSPFDRMDKKRVWFRLVTVKNV